MEGMYFTMYKNYTSTINVYKTLTSVPSHRRGGGMAKTKKVKKRGGLVALETASFMYKTLMYVSSRKLD